MVIRMTREVEIFLFSVNAGCSGQVVQEILSEMGENGNVTVIDRDSVFNSLHLASAIMHAARSIIRKEARARAEPLEIIRWLTGSHQVSRSMEIAGPGERTDHILVVRVPSGWPISDDVEKLSPITEKVWTGAPLKGLVPVNAPFELGGEAACERMGLILDTDMSWEEKEKAVLEAVCSMGLK